MKIALHFMTCNYVSVDRSEVMLRCVVNGGIFVGLWIFLMLGATQSCRVVLAC